MSLKHYLRLAYKEANLTWDAILETFDQLEVTLQHHRENLILVYGASFNPLHQGYIDVQLSGLCPEVDALATVILPCEDYLLRNKTAASASNFFLYMHRRADILDAISSIPKDRVWVWKSTYFPFKYMLEALARLTKADGFDLVFSHLIGPDILRLENPLMILPYVSSSIIVTNKARHLETHFLPDKTPVLWSGFGEWSLFQDHHSGSCSSNLPFILNLLTYQFHHR